MTPAQSITSRPWFICPSWAAVVPLLLHPLTTAPDSEEAADFARLEREARSIAANGYEFAHWAITDERDEFARCEATDLHGACTTVEAVYFHKDA